MAHCMQCIAVLIWPLRETCQSAGHCLWPIILLQKPFVLSLIRRWTAVCGQRPACLCGRTPANLAVESGWLPDFSGFLTASPVRLSTPPFWWACFPARFTCLPVLLNLNPQWPLYLYASWISWTGWLKYCQYQQKHKHQRALCNIERGHFIGFNTTKQCIQNESHLIPCIFLTRKLSSWRDTSEARGLILTNRVTFVMYDIEVVRSTKRDTYKMCLVNEEGNNLR